MTAPDKPEPDPNLRPSSGSTTGQQVQDTPAASAAQTPVPPASLPNLLESKIIQAMDAQVTQTDAPVTPTGAVSPQAVRNGHPPRHGLLIFCPHRLVETVWQISPDEFRQLGIQGIILDLDNTLVRWQQDEMAVEVTTWLQALLAANIKLCILSNSMMGKRSQRIAEGLKSAYVLQARKPAKQGFEKAMQAMGTVPATTAIVGDQMFTDIWGGNRTGIYTIMVKPIHPHEFPYTRFVSRPPEKLLLKYFKRSGKI